MDLGLVKTHLTFFCVHHLCSILEATSSASLTFANVDFSPCKDYILPLRALTSEPQSAEFGVVHHIQVSWWLNNQQGWRMHANAKGP